MGTASARAEAVLARLVAVLVVGHALVEPVSLAADWGVLRAAPVVALGPAVAIAYAAYLAWWGAEPSPDDRRVDLAFCCLALVVGVAGELALTSPVVAGSMANPGFTCVAIVAYAGSARLRPPVSLALVATAALGHAVALRQVPALAISGAFLLLGIWVAAVLVTGALRRAAQDADAAAEEARRAERDEQGGRVHDALNVVRVLARGEVALDLTVASVEGDDGEPRLHGRLEVVRAEFADLDLTVRVDDLAALDQDPAALDAVTRAVRALLGNVREHAGPCRARIDGADVAGGWRLTVQDDGRGFDLARTVPGRGLSRFSRDLLEPAGIDMAVVSAPGRGTSVVLSSTGSPDPSPAVTRPEAVRCWHRPPAPGLARSLWLVDLARGLYLASLWLVLPFGFPQLAATSARPVLAVTLALLGPVALDLHWALSARPTARTTVPVAVVAVLGAAAVTALGGEHAAQGHKIGIAVGAWACIYLAATCPAWSGVAAGLGLLQAAVLWRDHRVDAVLSAGWVVVGVVLAAGLARALTTFGAEADRDRSRAVAAERRTAAAVLGRQRAALRAAASAGGTVPRRELELAARAAEEYLLPPSASSRTDRRLAAALAAIPHGRGRLDVDVDAILDPAPTEDAVVEIVARVVGDVLAHSQGTVTVRGSGSGPNWRVTVLGEMSATPDALSGPGWADVQVTRLADETVLVALRPKS